MRELYKQYGYVILILVVTGLMFTMIFSAWNNGKGFMTTVGEDVGFILEDIDKGDVETDGVNTVLNRDKPTIKIKSHLDEKKTYYLVDNFVIKDADGYVWDRTKGLFVNPNNSSQTQNGKVIILSIRDSFGNYYYDSMNGINRKWDYATQKIYDVTGTDAVNKGIFNRSTGQITFPLADTYTVKVRIMDCENVTATLDCRISVDYVLE